VGVAPSSAIQLLDRAVRLRSTLRRQLVACAGFAVVSLAFAAVEQHAWTLAAAAGVICVALAMGAGVVGGQVREQARNVVADGDLDANLQEVERERRRLTSDKHRGRLAAALEYELRTAQEPPLLAGRPTRAVVKLRRHAETVREIAAAVRDPRSDVRGVALLDRFLSGALYVLPDELLARELWRIRFRLLAR
jgi:hypothetical protein